MMCNMYNTEVEGDDDDDDGDDELMKERMTAAVMAIKTTKNYYNSWRWW